MKSTLITLPLYLLSNLVNFTRNNSIEPWNIVRNIFGINTNLNTTNLNTTNHEIIKCNSTYLNCKKEEDVIKIFYPKGSYSPSKQIVGGIGFFASPKRIFMTNEVVFKYQVYFDDTFEPVFGGKLPGLFIGNGTKRENMVGASGGKHLNTSSCRIAWRSNLTAEAYIYVPPHQHQNFYNISNLILNPQYGHSLWRGLFQFYKYQWNEVSIRLKTNTFINNLPNYDGELEITINNVTQSFNQLLWRTDPEYNINAIIFETFFGGSKPKTATPNDTWSYFKTLLLKK